METSEPYGLFYLWTNCKQYRKFKIILDKPFFICYNIYVIKTITKHNKQQNNGEKKMKMYRTNRRRTIEINNDDLFIEMRINKRLVKNFIIKAINFLVSLATLFALLAVVVLSCGMIEDWKVSAVPLTITILCGAWLVIFGWICYHIEK